MIISVEPLTTTYLQPPLFWSRRTVSLQFYTSLRSWFLDTFTRILTLSKTATTPKQQRPIKLVPTGKNFLTGPANKHIFIAK